MPYKQEVVGSIPTSPTIENKTLTAKKRKCLFL